MRAYRTVQKEAQIELVIQKSRFIGRCFPVTQEDAALSKLAELRKQHWDATHNCFAYCIGADASAARFSDDGEPAGTAGLPMMEAVRQKGLVDILCVVTRYFGGVLLGAGGLVRAYSRAASMSMEAAGIVEMRPCVTLLIKIDYSRFAVIEPLLRKDGNLKDIRYTEDVEADLVVPEEDVAAFSRLLIEKTDGRVQPQETGRAYGAFPL